MTGHIDPEREAFKLFKEMPRDEPIQMLNLLRLRDKAAYPDGRDVSGFEAYKTYGQTSGPVFKRVGGTIVWRGAPKLTLIGPSEENWHLSFVAAYPSAGSNCIRIGNPSTMKVHGKMQPIKGNSIFTGASIARRSARWKRSERH